MNKYKVVTRWTGYSEIEVEARDKTHAHEIVDAGEYDPSVETSTGDGLSYGYEDEKVIELYEIEEQE